MSKWVDQEQLQNLKELDLSDGEFVPRLIRIFLETTPGQLGQLREAITAGESGRWADLAHGLLSSTQNLGARPMSRILEQLVETGRRGERQIAEPLVENLVEAFASTKTELEKYR